MSERRACRVLGQPRTTQRYQSTLDEPADLRIRLRDLASSRVRFGYQRLHLLFKREGWHVNHKLVYRWYVEEGLQMRTKRPRRHKSCQVRKERPPASRNESWSMDFMARRRRRSDMHQGICTAEFSIVKSWSCYNADEDLRSPSQSGSPDTINAPQ